MLEKAIVAGEELFLHPERAVYWPSRKILLLADLHLGKGAHFRRAGIAVPLGVQDRNFARLELLLREFSPARVLFLGDLFHSDYNHVWGTFCTFLETWRSISFELVPGNHDILSDRAYAEARMLHQPLVLEEGPFALSHHPLTEEEQPAEKYNLCGHVHPGVRMVGPAGESMKLPAFYFGAKRGILPAFGEFTGSAAVPVKPDDQVFVLVEKRVLAVS